MNRLYRAMLRCGKSVSLCVLMVAALLSACCEAEVPAIAAVMDDLAAALCEGRSAAEVAQLDDAVILGALNPEQRRVLSTEYWQFDVNVPVLVSIMRDTDQAVAPFWLEEQGFVKTALAVRNENYTYEVWQKPFPAGKVGLGINGFDRHRPHYFVGVGPQTAGDMVAISNTVPAPQQVYAFKEGAAIYHDWSDLVLTEVPEAFKGHVVLPTIRGRAREAQLIGAFRETAYPSSNTPDMAVLTWSDDPQTTQTIQWRSALAAAHRNRLWYRVKESGHVVPWREAEAESAVLYDRAIINDRRVRWHTVTLSHLQPGTAYEYTLENPEEQEPVCAEFRTAPLEAQPFTFFWMSDTHNRPDNVGVLAAAREKHPDAAFLTISGDLVGTGQERDDWDELFHNYADFLRETPLMPSIGNHDAIDGLGSDLYRALLRLPDNGPPALKRGQSYSLRYANLLLISLDVTEDIALQRPWLEETLRESDAPWKIAVLHFPPYALEREYPDIEREWGTLFDQYHVDLALSGHVHYHLRTWPLKDGKRMEKASNGTIYLISVAIDGPGEKGAVPDYAELVNLDGHAVCVAFTVDANRLDMKAYTADGTIYDTFTLEKP